MVPPTKQSISAGRLLVTGRSREVASTAPLRVDPWRFLQRAPIALDQRSCALEPLLSSLPLVSHCMGDLAKTSGRVSQYEVDPSENALRLGHAGPPLWSAASASRARNPFGRWWSCPRQARAFLLRICPQPEVRKPNAPGWAHQADLSLSAGHRALCV